MGSERGQRRNQCDHAFRVRFARARVLLVEDNEVNRVLATEMLNLLGCNVTYAPHGVAALEKLAESEFDVVLMDCQMPMMDGLTATACWRATEAAKLLPRTRIVALTANALEGDREACIAAGSDDFLAKPFRLSQLRGVLGLPPAAVEVTHAVPAPPALDAAAVDAVLSLDPDGSAGLFGRLRDLYVRDSRELLESLAAGIAARDAGAVAKVAHNLKSASANLGAARVAAFAAKIEAEARAGKLDDLTHMLTELLAAHASALSALESVGAPQVAVG